MVAFVKMKQFLEHTCYYKKKKGPTNRRFFIQVRYHSWRLRHLFIFLFLIGIGPSFNSQWYLSMETWPELYILFYARFHSVDSLLKMWLRSQNSSSFFSFFKMGRPQIFIIWIRNLSLYIRAWLPTLTWG